MANNHEDGRANANQQRNGIRKLIPPGDVSNAIATGLNTLATILLVVVGAWGVGATRDALELSERAWISVVGGGFTTAPAAKDAIHFVVSYMNSGKEPATDVNFAFSFDPIDAPQNDDFTSVKFPENTNCSGLEPKRGMVAAPLPNNVYNLAHDTGRGEHPLFLGDEELGGHRYVVIQGCAAYRTFNKTHRSGFCTIFIIKPAPKSPAPVDAPQASNATKSAPAPITQTTSAPEAPKWVWNSVLCPTGFSAD